MNPLRDAGKGTGGGFRGGRLSSALVVAEIALSLVLLNSAGLLMRSFIKLQTHGPGSRSRERAHHAGSGRSRPTEDGGRSGAVPHAGARAHSQRCRASSTPPPRSACRVFGGFGSDFDVAGIAHADRWRGDSRSAAMAISERSASRWCSGRDFTADDLNGARKVALVNQRLRRSVPEGNQRDRPAPRARASGRKRRQRRPGRWKSSASSASRGTAARRIRPGPEAFVPPSAAPVRGLGIVVRTSGHASGDGVQTIKREIWTVDPGVAIAETDDADDVHPAVRVRRAASGSFRVRRVCRRSGWCWWFSASTA